MYLKYILKVIYTTLAICGDAPGAKRLNVESIVYEVQ